MHKYMIKYEIKNYLNNLMGLCYLIVLPLGLALLFALITEGGPNPATSTYLLIMFSSLVPIAATFNHAGNYANELESGAVQRFKLFGYSESKMLLTKLLVNLIFISVALVIYFGVLFLALNIQPPTPAAFVTLIAFLYILSAVLFIFMHATATLCGNFSITYGVTLIMLFVFMLLGKMMNVDLGTVSCIFPVYHLNKGFLAFWNGGGFNFVPLILSTVGFLIFSVALMALSIFVNKKRIDGKTKKKGILHKVFKFLFPFKK